MVKCCLCKKEIEIINGWDSGNNAEPVKNGRCCDKCNFNKVILKRLREVGVLK